MKSRSLHTPARAALGAFVAVLLPLAEALAQSDPAQGSVPDPVARTRGALEQWVETARILSKEKQEWRVGREVLRDRIDLVQRETGSLQKRIGEAERSIGEADEKRRDLVAQNERLQADGAVLAARIVALETSVRQLLGRLPETLRTRVAPLSQRIPEDAAATKLSLGERYQNVVFVLNEVNKFQRDVHLVREVRTLEGGRTAEVSVLYFGIALAWYVTDDGKEAGTGTPSDQGFVWKSVPGAAPAIARAVAIKKGEQVAAFVLLPVTVE